MDVQVMCDGGLPSVSSGIGAGERLLKSGNFLLNINMDQQASKYHHTKFVTKINQDQDC
jgi:hypothetical protein